jgi:ABC-type transport system substrate-binding protein
VTHIPGADSIDVQDRRGLEVIAAFLDADSHKTWALINRAPADVAVALLGLAVTLGKDVYGSAEGLREATTLALARTELADIAGLGEGAPPPPAQVPPQGPAGTATDG